MRPRFTSTKTTGTCRVCGALCHPRRGQRIAEHTEAMHYELPWGDIEPKRLKSLRADWIANNLQGNPKIRELLGKRATLTVYSPGETIVVPHGRSRSQVGGLRTLQGPKLREAKGVFDYSGQSFTFIEDDGVVWEIDADVALNPIRLCAHLTFR